MDISSCVEKSELERLNTRKGFVQMCLKPTYKLPDNSDDEMPLDDEYDPCKPNDYEQMLLRKRRIEKQLTTLI